MVVSSTACEKLWRVSRTSYKSRNKRSVAS